MATTNLQFQLQQLTDTLLSNTDKLSDDVRELNRSLSELRERVASLEAKEERVDDVRESVQEVRRLTDLVQDSLRTIEDRVHKVETKDELKVEQKKAFYKSMPEALKIIVYVLLTLIATAAAHLGCATLDSLSTPKIVGSIEIPGR